MKNKKTKGEQIEVSDDNLDAFFDEVYDLFENGENDKALKKLDEIDENNSQYSRALFYKSIIMGESGEYGVARDLFNESILQEYENQEEMDYEDLSYLGFSSFQDENYEEAIEFFDLSLELNKNQIEVVYAKLFALYELYGKIEALKFIDKIIKENNDDTSFLIVKSDFLQEIGDDKNALKCLNDAFKINPDNVEVLLGTASFYMGQKNFDVALKFFDKALEIIPDDSTILISKAQIYLLKDDFKEAKKLLNKVKVEDRENIDYLMAMGQLMMTNLKAKEAIGYYDKCLEIDDEIAEAWLYKGLMSLLLDNEDDYDKCLTKAFELDPMIMLSLEELFDEFDLNGGSFDYE